MRNKEGGALPKGINTFLYKAFHPIFIPQSYEHGGKSLGDIILLYEAGFQPFVETKCQ